MPDQKIFCNVPWTNLHIYWNGSYGACCSERHPPHHEPDKFNLHNITIDKWYNSLPMQQIRNQIKSSQKLSQCQGCYREENVGHESRRIKENFKSVIFTEQSFDRSYEQSPMFSDFESNTTTRLPIDWHVDLGNECNLACKMCNPHASSKISSMFTKWKLINESANRNWTLDPVAWDNFLKNISLVPNLNRMHFMGGEPLLNKRFPELLDHLIQNNQKSVTISFVTNGTIINPNLIDKLKQFRSCDIEVSLESVSNNNHYIRQGSDTDTVLKNIKFLSDQQTDQFHVVLRSVPQLLNINNYDQYILYAWNNQLPVQSIPLIEPDYLQISVLPIGLRQKFIQRYVDVKNKIAPSDIKTLATGRNVGALNIQLRRECDAMIAMLTAPEPDNVQELRQRLSQWLMRWDQEYRLNAYDHYPEYREFLNDIQYTI